MPGALGESRRPAWEACYRRKGPLSLHISRMELHSGTLFTWYPAEAVALNPVVSFSPCDSFRRVDTPKQMIPRKRTQCESP